MDDLHLIARDLIASASDETSSGCVGRDSELEALRTAFPDSGPLRLLLRGPQGAGRSTCMRALAHNLRIRPHQGIQRVLDVNITALAGGSFLICEAVDSLLKLAGRSNEVVLFFENLGSLYDLQKNEKGQAGKVLRALAERDISYIGTVTPEEFKNARRRKDTVYCRCIVIDIKPLSARRSLFVLQQVRPSIESRIGIQISASAMRAAIELLTFMPGKVHPGGAVELLGRACERYQLKYASKQKSRIPGALDSPMAHLGAKVSYYDVKRVVEEMNSTNIEAIQASEYAEKLRGKLAATVVGQDSAVSKLSKAMARICVDIKTGNKATDAIFVCGPFGCGKMRTIRALAEALLHDEDDLLIHDVKDLAGVEKSNALFGQKNDHEWDFESSALIRRVRSAPLTFIVFKNISSAPKPLFDSLNEILTTSYLRDVRGNKIDFRRTVLFFVESANTWDPNDKEEPPLDTWLAKQYMPKELSSKLTTAIQFGRLSRSDLEAMLFARVLEFRNQYGARKPDLRIQKRVLTNLIQNTEAENDKGNSLNARLDQYIFEPAHQLICQFKGDGKPVIQVVLEQETIRLQLV